MTKYIVSRPRRGGKNVMLSGTDQYDRPHTETVHLAAARRYERYARIAAVLAVIWVIVLAAVIYWRPWV